MNRTTLSALLFALAASCGGEPLAGSWQMTQCTEQSGEAVSCLPYRGNSSRIEIADDGTAAVYSGPMDRDPFVGIVRSTQLCSQDLLCFDFSLRDDGQMLACFGPRACGLYRRH